MTDEQFYGLNELEDLLVKALSGVRRAQQGDPAALDWLSDRMLGDARIKRFIYFDVPPALAGFMALRLLKRRTGGG